MAQTSFRVRTQPRAFENITERIAAFVGEVDLDHGLCHVFLRHTSASLILCENADPAVRRDFARFMQRTAPEDPKAYEHDAEGPDDMPAHIRTLLAGSSLTVPIARGRLLLGTWQGIYVWEHRDSAHEREVVVTTIGGESGAPGRS